MGSRSNGRRKDPATRELVEQERQSRSLPRPPRRQVIRLRKFPKRRERG